jgi:hypothetical protein
MSSTTVLVAVSILAAAIAYAGNQLRGGGEMIVAQHIGDSFGVFQLKDGQVRYCQNMGDPTTPANTVGCTSWSD